MYNPKFNFMKLLPELTIEFFMFPIKDKELEVLKEIGCTKLCKENMKNIVIDNNCPICFGEFTEGQEMLKLPVCKH